ncbi:MAG: septal ring lytic transglycosylase RlpA family protein [Bergeyella sp.]|nr:septal ring lytic transglycosylase RlpA family protein [Bergeyella sp.]
MKKLRIRNIGWAILFILSTIFFTSFAERKSFVFVSFYSDRFNGRKTASGEIFSNKMISAAHKKLSFGTQVKITNIKNGKSIIVKINDRGPYVKGRAFDLSKEAFRKIGSLKKGVLKVRYEILGHKKKIILQAQRVRGNDPSALPLSK